jgi:hypothetical protein
MIIERTSNEYVIRIPSFVDIEDVQRMIDLLMYKEATARSQATQEEVDDLAKEAKKGWWQANRDRFIRNRYKCYF